MGLVERGWKGEEPDGAGSGQELDLDLRACPACRRDLHPWQDVCPDDGAAAIPRSLLPTPGLPPIPAHLLDVTDE